MAFHALCRCESVCCLGADGRVPPSTKGCYNKNERLYYSTPCPHPTPLLGGGEGGGEGGQMGNKPGFLPTIVQALHACFLSKAHNVHVQLSSICTTGRT